jgi:hypothetical protein
VANKKIVVDPTAAETVHLVFTRYLELGPVKALARDLERRGIRTKERKLATATLFGQLSQRAGHARRSPLDRAAVFGNSGAAGSRPPG